MPRMLREGRPGAKDFGLIAQPDGYVADHLKPGFDGGHGFGVGAGLVGIHANRKFLASSDRAADVAKGERRFPKASCAARMAMGFFRVWAA